MSTWTLGLLWESSLWHGAGGLGTSEEGCSEMTVFIATENHIGCTQPPGYGSCSMPSENSEFCDDSI